MLADAPIAHLNMLNINHECVALMGGYVGGREQGGFTELMTVLVSRDLRISCVSLLSTVSGHRKHTAICKSVS